MTLRSLKYGVAAAALALDTAPAFAQGGGRGWMWDFGWGWGGMGGGLGMIVFWGVIILLIVLAVRGFGGSRAPRDLAPPPPPPPGEKTPLQILQERYARGEIDTAEYEERKKALGG